MGSKGETFFRIFQFSSFGSIIGIREEADERCLSKISQLPVTRCLLVLYVATDNRGFQLSNISLLLLELVVILTPEEWY